MVENKINILKEKFPQYNYEKSVYKSDKEKITVTCKIHGDFEVLYNKAIKNKTYICPKCNGAHKYNSEDALNKLKFRFPNYDFSKFEYKGYNENCTLICENGHEVTKKYRSFSEGFGCNICKDKPYFICENGHEVKIKCSSNANANICPICNNEIEQSNQFESIRKMKIINNIKEIENKFPHIKILDIPDKKSEHINIECEIHGKMKSTISLLNKIENPCHYCSGYKPFKPVETLQKCNPEYDFSYFDYEYAHKQSVVICKKHGRFKASYNYARKYDFKVFCPKCHDNCSAKELMIRQFLCDELKLNVEKNKSIIKSKTHENFFLEIDMYIPDLKIGFEFNGTYWHSDKYFKKKWSQKHKEAYINAEGYHKYKYEEAKRNGIDLYFITEEEFDSDISALKDKIKNIISNKVTWS